MFRKMPFLLLLLIATIAVTAPWLPLPFQSALYALSLSLKALILFALPFLIFGLIFSTAAQMAKQASTWILMVLVAVCVSNFVSTLLSFSVGQWVHHFDIHLPPPGSTHSLVPLWIFEPKCPIKNSIALLSGLILGITLGWARPQLASTLAHKLSKAVSALLKILMLVIPVFVAGFAVKLIHDKMLTLIFKNYINIFLVIALSALSYILLLLLFVSGFDKCKFATTLKNMLPAALVGLGSMSSAAAMPLTLVGVSNSATKKDKAKAVVPLTVNIHLIGDCFAIPILAFAILKSFGLPPPSITGYLLFAGFFVLAKFSVAAVPGGGILVMLPVLESHLGFNAEMLSLITALYILFDPITTPANILGNGALALGFGNLGRKKSLTKPPHPLQEKKL